MSRQISRRTVLKGIGTAMSLPMLEAMMPTSVLAQSVPAKQKAVRMAFVFVPNGMNMQHWTPSAEGSGFSLPSTMEPLSRVKDNLNVFTGLAQRNAFALGDGPGDHARSTAVWLTGVHPKKTAGADIKNGPSVDQIAAQRIGDRTKFASLEIGCERGAQAGDCDSGYSCAYSSNISWRSETTPVAKEVNPRLVFERLFGSGEAGEEAESRFRRERYRKSILDLVLEDALALKKELGKRDAQKLDEYLAGVREIERRLERIEKENPTAFLAANERPKGIPADYGEHIRLMGDMMVLAFQADLTRIATFMFANDGSNRPFRDIGITDGHHDISHHANEAAKLEKKRQIDRWQVEQVAYILEKMQNTRELDGTLLDNSMIVFGAGISDGNRHNHDDLPILMAGKGGGSIRTGRHVRFPRETPMTNLFITMLDKVGVDVEKLGDSTGKLQGLL
jgi:hypothetical protein